MPLHKVKLSRQPEIEDVYVTESAEHCLPKIRSSTVIQRILIRHGVSRDLAQLLLDDLGRALDHLQANPILHSSAGPTFHH